MTSKERAEKVDIPMVDAGDWHVSKWEIDVEQANANIAQAIEAAVLEEREACIKWLEEEDFEYDYSTSLRKAREKASN